MTGRCKMLRAFLSSYAVTLVGVACAFGSHLLLARILPAAEYGVFSFVFSLSLLLGIFALFGFQNSVVKLIPQYLADQKSFYKIGRLIGFAIFFTGVLAGVTGAVVYGGLSVTHYADLYSMDAFLVGIGLTLLMVMIRLMAGFVRGFQKSAISVFYETSLREIGFVVLLGGMLLFGFQLTSGVQALLILAAVMLVVVLIAALHVHRLESAVDGQGGDARGGDYRDWIKLSFPMMLVIVAQRVMRRSDIVILGLMVSPALVGAYAIAAQFADVSSIAQKGIVAVFSPRASSLHAKDDREGLRGLYGQMRLYGIVVTGGAAIVIGVLAPTVIGFFGDDYMVGYRALLILLVGQFVNMGFGPVAALLMMTGQEKIAMRYTAMAAAGNVVFNPLAIVAFGLEGAAFVTVFFLIMRNVLSYRVARHTLWNEGV